ncbi:MAG TPA: NPCBM/NEW2 domain-containing protein [Planctomycetota bacterium]|nr:NPCBM/NEW2 domain-containing protein [Planctomycetota bacterium]
MRRPAQLIACLVTILTGATAAWAASPPDVVRRDWYFRESLAAIADWEEILAGHSEDGVPVLPVPTNGEAVEWPNPIPLMLLPDEDAKARVRVRLTDGKMHVEHVAPDGKVERTAVAPGEPVVGYKHPGGGGKSYWYHSYVRKFDRLLSFRPRPAPFALCVNAPLDLKRGANDATVVLHNVSDKPLALKLSLRLLRPGSEPKAIGSRDVDIPPTEKREVRCPVELPAEGGGLVLLTVAAGTESYWLPLFTHVEKLGDDATRLAGAEWRAAFERASELRDQRLLAEIAFDTLLFVKRKPYTSEQPYMDAHHCHNPPGGGIHRLSPVRPDGKVTPVVDSLGEGIYRDLCLHWDAKKLLFAFGNGVERAHAPVVPGQSYHIYEVNVDGTGLRQVTAGPKNDCEPFYLPDGRIAFTSDRSEHYVMCGSNIHAPNLFRVNADGSGLRRLSHNVFNDFNPSILPDGRIIYDRWEYNERSVTSLHDLFTMRPDGSMVAPFYGNATIRPNVIMFPRAVPGSTKVTALFTGHHGQTHGPIGLIDVRKGADGDAPVTVLTPGVPVIGEKIQDSRRGWFSDPVPLSETTYLCSYTPTVQPWLERSWALYVGDRHGNLALVYRDPAISCAEPLPLVPRPRPHLLPPVEAEGAEATLVLMNVYEGLPGVRRGEARALRIIEDVPRVGVHEGGVICTSGTPIYTVKRILGTVPIEADGSAHFVVPADRNVYFEILDARHREIQRMRSVVCMKPGETRTCIGCHEPRTMAPPNRLALAASREPSRPAPPPWGDRIFSFLRDVQPLLNAKCIRCHTHDRATNAVILTDDLTDQFTVGYQELLPCLSVANAMRWDSPDDVYPRLPYTYGSKVSRLTQILEKGHHDVKLSDDDWQRLLVWIDANAVYYDRYETPHWPNRRIFAGAERKALDEAYGRRCARCHGRTDGRGDTWWLSLNRRDPRLSRMLMAPLSRAAGGWGRCEGTVFASAADAHYKAMLAALTSLADALKARPREDLLSTQGTSAEAQKVEVPPPPAAKPRPVAELPEGGEWVSDLPWEKASAGWTANKDGVPRRDKDVEDHPLRLGGGRRYRKGIGTHAPSEIVYRLDGKYARFVADVGGAEERGTVVFQVYGDEKLLVDSGVLHGMREVKAVDLPVAGMRTLRLVVTDAGDGIVADMANWAGARVVRAEPK